MPFPPASLGCLHVGPRYEVVGGVSSPPGATVFEDGVGQIAAAGFQGVGVFASPNYKGDFAARADYVGESWGATPANLTQLMQTTAYQALLTAGGVKRVFFKFWTFASGIGDPWKVQTLGTDLQAEYTEVYNWALYLLQNTAGKDFYLQTSESDWALIGATVPTQTVPADRLKRAIAFFGTHVQAIRDAREAAGLSTSRVFSVIEVNRVTDGGQYRVHHDVLPFLSPDCVSMSIYEGINGWLGFPLSWTPEALNFSSGAHGVNAVAYGNGIWVAAGQGGEISSSSDGATWVLRTSTFGAANINAVIWSTRLQKFIAVGAGGHLATSADGATWTAQTSGTVNGLNGVVDTGFLQAFGDANTLIFSVSGTSWSPVTQLGSPTTGDLICGSSDVVSGDFVVAGTNGLAMRGSGNVAVAVSSGFGGATIRAVTPIASTGTFVAVGDGGGVSTSGFGGAGPWTPQSSGLGTALLAVASGNGILVAAGTGGQLVTSPDGIMWTTQTSGTSSDIHVVCWHPGAGTWVYGTADGHAGISTASRNGVIWGVVDAGTSGNPVSVLTAGAGPLLAAAGAGAKLSLSVNLDQQVLSVASVDTLVRQVVGRIRESYGRTHGFDAAAALPLYFGEWGWPEANTTFQTLDVGPMMDQLLTTAADVGIQWANYWQLWSNDIGPAGGVTPGTLVDQCVIRSSPPTSSVIGAKLLALV